MENLTFLGALKLTNKGSNHDPDTYLETSAGYCEIDAEKSPVGFYRGWYYYVIKFNERNSVLQVITPDNATTKECYFRKGHGASDGTYSWTSWSLWPYDIPSFYKNYTDLNSLASALGGLKGKSVPDGSANNVYRTFSFYIDTYGGSASFLLDSFDGAFLITALRWAGSSYERVSIIQLTDTEVSDINDFSWSVDNGNFTVYFGRGTNVNTRVVPLDNVNVTVGTSSTAGGNSLVKQNIPSFYKNYSTLSALSDAMGMWDVEARAGQTTTRVNKSGVYYFNSQTADVPSDIGTIDYGIFIHCCILDDGVSYHGVQ